ncbi:ATP-grasp domain-containing protein [Nesterenkonia marinintestina]|uniref:ATP-grasp domain-containing protein n=1 Tax=Nesterenkonia marinintestina TaxID=2979865 RepID=UPI0021BF6A4D|nr:ATP-grasp domain-containing protein [Nesterenkonia sp. GX14115]
MTPAEADANARFVAEHIAHRYLEFNPLTKWPGHRGALKVEARGRGLSVSEYANTMTFFDDGVCVGATTGLVSSLIGYSASRLARSKRATREILETAGMPVPSGTAFSADGAVRARRHIEEMLRTDAERRFVMKPSDGNAGRGITTGIGAGEEVAGAWKRAQAASKDGEIIIEEQVAGVDVRVFVVGDRVVAAAVRIPAHVIGDGSRSLEDLAEEYTVTRRVNAYLGARDPYVDARHLARRELTMESVPSEGEVVFLNGTTNISQGGISVDVTEVIAPELLDVAVRAAHAVPGLGTAGVDLLVPDLSTPEGAHVIELNPSANCSINQFPAYGQGRDVSSALIEEMRRSRT